MGILGLSSKEPAEAEAEQDTDQTGQRNPTNFFPPHVKTYLRSSDEKRFFGDYEVGADAEPIPVPTNSPRRDDMSGKVNVEGLFKPRNTLQQSLPSFEQPAKTYGKSTGPRRIRTEAVRGGNVLNTEERWNLHADHKPQKRKKLTPEPIPISDDEAATKRDTGSVYWREDTRSNLDLGIEPNLSRAMNGDVPEYSGLEKRMKASVREKPYSGRASTPARRFDHVGVRENPPHLPFQAQSAQVEEISDEEGDALKEPYRGTSYLKRRVIKRSDGDGSRALQNVKSTAEKSTYCPRSPFKYPHPHGRLASLTTPRFSRGVLKRTEETDNSPDVLHNRDNIGIRTQPRVRDRMTTNGHSEPVHRSRSPPPVSLLHTSQSSTGVPITTFINSRKKNETLGQSSPSARKFKPPQGFSLMLEQLICSSAPPSPGDHKYHLKFEYANGDANVIFECECKAMECAQSLGYLAFQVKKIMKIVYFSTMIQIMLSKNGTQGNVILFQASDPAEADQLLTLLVDIAKPKVIIKDEDHMEKIFQHSKKHHHALRSRRESDVGLDQDAYRILLNKERQKSRRDGEQIDSQPIAKRRRSELYDPIASVQRDSASHSEGYGNVRGNYYETRSKTRPDRTAQDIEDSKESHSLGGKQVSEYQETEFSKLKRNQNPWDRPLVFPADGPRKTTVDFGDLERLDQGEFLNDNIIAFYLRYLEQELELKHASIASRVYFFNTFFYERLTSRGSGKKGINYEGVQKWTSKIDIFKFDYVVVPVNESAHWYVAIICNLPNLSRPKSVEQERESSVEDTKPSGGKGDIPVQAAGPSPGNSSRQSTIADAADLDHGVVEVREQVARISLVKGDMSEEIGDLDSKRTPNDSFEMNAGADEDENWPAPDENPPTKIAGGISSINCDVSYQGHAENAKISEHLSGVQFKGQQKSIKPRRKSSLRKYNVDAPIIIILDSLGLAHNVTARNLKEYLVEEGKSKRQLEVSIQDIGAMNSKEIPLQGNFCDCGIYLLIYIEKFLKDPRSFVNRILTREMDQRDDWPDLDPSAKRNDLRDLLLCLYRKQDDSRKREAISRGRYHKEPASGLVARGPRRNDRKHELLGAVQKADDTPVSKVSASGELRDLPAVVDSHPGVERPKSMEGGGKLLPQGESHDINLLRSSSYWIGGDHPTRVAMDDELVKQPLTESEDPGKTPAHLRRTTKAQDVGSQIVEVVISPRGTGVGPVTSPRRGFRGRRPSPELNNSIVLD